MSLLKRCDNCSRPGRGIYHPGKCPGVRATALDRVLSPFRRDDKDRRLYAKSNYANAPGHSDPWGRDPNPGAYGQNPKPVRLRGPTNRVTVGLGGVRRR